MKSGRHRIGNARNGSNGNGQQFRRNPFEFDVVFTSPSDPAYEKHQPAYLKHQVVSEASGAARTSGAVGPRAGDAPPDHTEPGAPTELASPDGRWNGDGTGPPRATSSRTSERTIPRRTHGIEVVR